MHKEFFFWVDDVLKKYNYMKEEINNLKTACVS